MSKPPDVIASHSSMRWVSGTRSSYVTQCSKCLRLAWVPPGNMFRSPYSKAAVDDGHFVGENAQADLAFPGHFRGVAQQPKTGHVRRSPDSCRVQCVADVI